MRYSHTLRYCSNSRSSSIHSSQGMDRMPMVTLVAMASLREQPANIAAFIEIAYWRHPFQYLSHNIIYKRFQHISKTIHFPHFID